MASYQPSISAVSSVKIAVVGDIHDSWDADSEAALASLGADIAVFVGDFGNENVDIVRQIASVQEPSRKIVMLGNHDAWYSLTPRGRARAVRVALSSSSLRAIQSASNSLGSYAAVEEMLDLLGPTHVGHGAAAHPELGLAFVGGRAFSKGGRRWDDISAFYQHHYGIGSLEESAHRIVDVALSQPSELSLIVVSHNGPTGLGGDRHSPCGVDWQLPEEDFGDPDLGEALDTVAAQGRPAALVLFGHMHETLKGGGRRNMAAVDAATGTVYLNSAVVPRVRSFRGDGGTARGHHFLMVQMERGAVAAARHVWAGGTAAGAAPGRPVILEAEEVVKSVEAGDGSGRRVVSYFRANTGEWAPVVVKGVGGTGGGAEQLQPSEAATAGVW
jgi:uncharacterized protein (TIGR04168 family)